MKRLFYTLGALSLLPGCQHSILEPIAPIPLVDVRIEAPKTAVAGKNEEIAPLHRVYLYPQFDYPADPIVFDTPNNVAQVALLPGLYQAVVHSLPVEPLVLSGTESFETAMVSLPTDEAGNLPSCPTFYTLHSNDPMNSAEIVRTEEGRNLLIFNPILATKRIRIELNTTQFGTITSAHGTITGVASALNLYHFKTASGKSIQFDNISISGNKLIIEAFEVLGFTAEKSDDVVLTVFVRNDEVDFELEQPVDLTQEIQKLPPQGGDVHITIDLKFNPDIRVHPVTIRQWDESGNELEIGFK